MLFFSRPLHAVELHNEHRNGEAKCLCYNKVPQVVVSQLRETHFS